MTQKQHVDIQRKLKLRQTLIEKADQATGACYIPFIGEGDIAVALYKGQTIYGADIDPTMVEKAKARLPGAEIIVADCDNYPFNKDIATFGLADFDSYSYPYNSFRSFFKGARIGSQCVLCFTDGQRQAIIRTGHYQTPDGEKIKIKSKADKRTAYNFYFNKIILPWFTAYIKPYHIVYITKYLRAGSMCYWGALIALPGKTNNNNTPTTPTPTTPITNTGETLHNGEHIEHNNESGIKPYKFTSIKKKEYLEHIADGHTRGYAATLCGVSRWTVSDHVKKDKEFADAIPQAESDAIGKVENALHEAATSGNVTAIQVYLYNRDPKRWSDRRNIQIAGEGGGAIKVDIDAKGKLSSILERLASKRTTDDSEGHST